MKKIFLTLALSIVLGVSGMENVAFADDVEKTLADAWTAYNIGKYKETLNLAQPLALDGNPRAQIIIGKCYENGLGVPQDMTTAAKWYQLAAEQNNSEAQVLLAYQYELGIGLPRDEAALTSLMRRAADAGNAEAQFNLALYYSQGRYGFPKDQAESFRWAKASADQGFAQAQRYVGVCYEEGVGVSKNLDEAELWYAKAAAQGLKKEEGVFTRVREYPMQ